VEIKLFRIGESNQAMLAARFSDQAVGAVAIGMIVGVSLWSESPFRPTQTDMPGSTYWV
jgi:hypothetical protein